MEFKRGETVLVDHLDATYKWLCVAQDSTPDGGIAGWYHLRHNRWASSYPETTGYIIPTMFDYAAQFSSDEARRRAVRMADWEISVQLPTGAVQSGTMDTPPAPAVFNTGQVIQGWTRAYRETGDRVYFVAAQRAADWLVSVQDQDGAWRTHLSAMTTSSVCTYNARAAWGLVQLGQLVGEKRWIEAGRRNLDWSVPQQQPNEWFSHSGFADGEIPLLHTIAYVMEGLLEAGLLLDQARYVSAAQATAAQLQRIFGERGELYGRYDKDWNASVRWRCLPGEAQTALVWLRLYEVTGERVYLNSARQLNRDLMQTQDLKSVPGVRGGVKGSHPIRGGYFPYSYLNWAAKFLLDALMLQARIEKERST